MTIHNKRPGVYSSYDVAFSYTAPISLKYAAVVAKAVGGEADTLYSFKSYRDACEVFGPDTDEIFIRSILAILFESGVSEVLAVPVDSDYKSALDVIKTAENIGAVICDARDTSELSALKAHVLESSKNQRECLGFCGIDDAEAAIAAADGLNCERVVMTSPAISLQSGGNRSAILAAAALAGRILASGDAALNLNGEAFPLLKGPEALPENTIQAMLEAGISVFESVGGEVECVRAQTTCSKVNNVPDRSLTGINTIMIIDDVMQTVRGTLKKQLRGGRISGSPIDSIRSQVTVILDDKQNDGLLESYMPPRCYPSDYDPEVCIVEMSFAVAHAVSQIHITAHIQI